MQAVMEKLQIAKGTIYHYFNSKEALLEAVIENIVDENVEEMKLALEASKGTALEKLQMLISAGRVAVDNEKILEPLHQSANIGMHIRLLAVAIKKQAPLYEAIIRQGCDEGVFQVEAPLECAEYMLSAIQFLTDQGIYPWTQAELLRRVKAMPGILEAQLKAPPASFQFMLNMM
jgi:AcrR family transcriptional regulator